MLALYGADESVGKRLGVKLQARAHIHWIDSRLVPLELLGRHSGQAQALLLDYSGSRQAAQSSEIADAIRDILPETPLVAIGSTVGERAIAVLAALRAGVREFVDIDAPIEDIDATLRKVVAQAKPARSQLTTVPVRRGRMVLLLGVRAGLGTSTLAAHLGVMAQRSACASEDTASPTDGGAGHAQALLLDLSRPSGELGLQLGLESHFHYEDVLRNLNRIDATLVRTALAQHRSGLSFIGQAAGTLTPPSTGGEAAALIERLRGIFNLILCDVGGLPCQHVPLPMLQTADEIWLVTDQSIGSLVALDRTLSELEHLHLRDARLHLIVNRHDADIGARPVHIAERFDLPLLATVPERLKTLRASAVLGRLLTETAPRDPYLRALSPLIDRLSPESSTSTGASGWRHFLNRVSTRPWKRT